MTTAGMAGSLWDEHKDEVEAEDGDSGGVGGSVTLGVTEALRNNEV